MRPGIKKGQCCRDSVSQHPLLVITVVPADAYYGRIEEFLRDKLNNYKKFKIYGISLVDGSLKSFHIYRNSEVKKLTVAEAYLSRQHIRGKGRKPK